MCSICTQLYIMYTAAVVGVRYSCTENKPQ